MKIIKSYPPNYQEICLAIPGVAKTKTAVFTYDGCLYNPAGGDIPPELMAHEQTHVEQQAANSNWWTKYLRDTDFRLDQELEAYRVQYQYAVANYGREYRRKLLSFISKSLASPMYGNLITKETAKKLIQEV